jgi:hypothetical protein
MSRGIGRIQRLCLQVLADHGGMLDSINIAGKAMAKEVVQRAEVESFRRALRQLTAQGHVVDMSRHFHDNRKRWALPDQAEAYTARCIAAFGTKPKGIRTGIA